MSRSKVLFVFAFSLSVLACSSGSSGGNPGGDATSKADTGKKDLLSGDVTPTDVDSDATDLLDATTDEDITDLLDVSDYTGPACTTDTVCKTLVGTPFCAKLVHQCVECLLAMHCPDTNNCQGNKCIVFACKPGSLSCQSNALVTCNPDGKSVTTTDCPDDKPICSGDKCRLCEPKQLFCDKPAPGDNASKNLMKCSDDGMAVSVSQACVGDQTCQAKKCQACVPGTKSCDGNLAMACKDDGSAIEILQDCGDKSLTCLGGLCVNPCSSDFKSNTNVGCDYWAVDLDNAVEGKFNAQIQQFAVVVSNTAAAAATVTVTMGDPSVPATFKTIAYNVPPEKLQVIKLPDPSWKLPDQSQDGSTINARAYRIQATQPIVAYQFNPLENFGVFSNDASLLLPSYASGKTYWIMSRQQLGTFRSYFTVVATQPGVTSVQVSVTAKTLGGIKVPALKAGETKLFSLKQGEVLNIESDDLTADLSGSYVEADKNVVVFGGSEASDSPTDMGNCVLNGKGGTQKVCSGTSNSGFPTPCVSNSGCKPSCCADHLEEQMFPIATLGTTYVGAHLYARGKESDAWRIIAAEDKTTVKLTPNIGVNIPVLGQGQVFEFQSTKDFVINADKPILVAQYMASAYQTVTQENPPCVNDAQCLSKYGFMGKCLNENGTPYHCEPIGDPALILNAATTQYLSDYLFLVPDKYAVNYITIVTEVGSPVTLDKVPIGANGWVTIPGTTWSVLRMPITAGSHRLQSDKGSGLTVYGYDLYVSYGYAGGAGLSVK